MHYRVMASDKDISRPKPLYEQGVLFGELSDDERARIIVGIKQLLLAANDAHINAKKIPRMTKVKERLLRDAVNHCKEADDLIRLLIGQADEGEESSLLLLGMRVGLRKEALADRESARKSVVRIGATVRVAASALPGNEEPSPDWKKKAANDK